MIRRLRERGFTRSRERRRGAAMVEFALTFLLFLVVFLGTMEFGRDVWTYTTVTHAARQGARFAMVRGTINAVTEDQVRAIVGQNAVGLNDSDLSVATTWSPDRERGSIVEVCSIHSAPSLVH